MRARKLFMICGNPDVVVERGDRLVYCAGAVADLYASMGGEVLYAGKPFRPIYDMALASAEQARPARRSRSSACCASATRCAPICAAPATPASISCSSPPGIHAEELGGRDGPDPEALRTVLGAAGELPKAVMRDLVVVRGRRLRPRPETPRRSCS